MPPTRISHTAIRSVSAALACLLMLPVQPTFGEAADPPDEEAGAEAPETAAFDLLRLPDMQVDGRTDDWNGLGLCLGDLQTPDGADAPAPEDLSATVWMAWDDRGLLVRVSVRDDAAVERADNPELYLFDSVEIFLSPARTSGQKIQCIIAPGIAKGAQRRVQIKDWRQDAKLKEDVALNVEAVATATEGGYVVEARLPWNAIGVVPGIGTAAVAQVLVNDVDPGKAKTTLAWYPRVDTYRVTAHMHRLRLVGHHHLSSADTLTGWTLAGSQPAAGS